VRCVALAATFVGAGALAGCGGSVVAPPSDGSTPDGFTVDAAPDVESPPAADVVPDTTRPPVDATLNANAQDADGDSQRDAASLADGGAEAEAGLEVVDAACPAPNEVLQDASCAGPPSQERASVMRGLDCYNQPTVPSGCSCLGGRWGCHYAIPTCPMQCPGCIDLNGRCNHGDTDTVCGSNSSTCVDCSAFGQICNDAGDCVAESGRDDAPG